MTATLTFNLDDPDDRKAHFRCIKSLDMAIALFDIVNNSWRNVHSIEDYRRNINDYLAGLDLNELID